MKIAPQSHPALRELAQSLQGQRIAMLTVRQADGLLVSRPMTPQAMDADGAIWILVAHGVTTEAVAQPGPGGNDAVNLAFSDERRATYISIAARATLVEELARKQALWSLMARRWFPGGPEDPSLALLRLQPQRAELWDGPSSGTLRALVFAASVLTGSPLGRGRHEVLGIRSSSAADARGGAH